MVSKWVVVVVVGGSFICSGVLIRDSTLGSVTLTTFR